MKDERLPIFMDFDNTLSDTMRVGDKFLMGAPLTGMVEAVNEASKQREIVIFTARPFSEWEQVRGWLDKAGVIYNGITNIKTPAIYYVDDHAMSPEEFEREFRPKRRVRIDLNAYYASEQDEI